MAQNVTSGRDLSANEKKALAALLAAPTITAAAERCGLTRETLHRYLRDPDFAAAYRERREQVVDEAVALLQRSGLGAVGVLAAALKEPDVAVRLRAAKTILDLLFRVSEQAELKRQLDEIQEFDRQYLTNNRRRTR